MGVRERAHGLDLDHDATLDHRIDRNASSNRSPSRSNEADVCRRASYPPRARSRARIVSYPDSSGPGPNPGWMRGAQSTIRPVTKFNPFNPAAPRPSAALRENECALQRRGPRRIST